MGSIKSVKPATLTIVTPGGTGGIDTLKLISSGDVGVKKTFPIVRNNNGLVGSVGSGSLNWPGPGLMFGSNGPKRIVLRSKPFTVTPILPSVESSKIKAAALHSGARVRAGKARGITSNHRVPPSFCGKAEFRHLHMALLRGLFTAAAKMSAAIPACTFEGMSAMIFLHRSWKIP